MFDGKPTFVTGPNRSELRLSPELTQLLLKNNQEDVVLAGNGFNQWCAGPAYEISQVQHILGSAELVRSFAPLAPRCVRCSPRREWSIPIVGIGLLGLLSLRAGETADEFFVNYTPEQLRWRDERAGVIQLYQLEASERRKKARRS